MFHGPEAAITPPPAQPREPSLASPSPIAPQGSLISLGAARGSGTEATGTGLGYTAEECTGGTRNPSGFRKQREYVGLGLC